MKRFFLILLITVLLLNLCGCDSIFARLQVLGGYNFRNFGEYKPMQSDGEYTYWPYSFPPSPDGYIKIYGDEFILPEDDVNSNLFSDVQSEVEIVAEIYKCSCYERIECYEANFDLQEKLTVFLAKNDHCEGVLLQEGDVIYGAINCYRRSAGRSGMSLAYEDFVESYIISIEDGEICILKTLKGMAVLALTQTHCVGYEDGVFYSVNLETGDSIKICNDLWWTDSPSHGARVSVYFADEYFMICGHKDFDYYTVIVGTIDGENISTLTDHKKVG